MSKFSTVYDRLLVYIPTLTGFTTKTRISNPYSLPDNDVNLMRDGWGFKVNSGAPSVYQEYNTITLSHEFEIVLSREVKRTAHDTSSMDTQIKNMIEDSVTLLTLMLNADQIGIESDLQQINLVSRGSIEFQDSDNFNFIFTSLTFSIDITETI